MTRAGTRVWILLCPFSAERVRESVNAYLVEEIDTEPESWWRTHELRNLARDSSAIIANDIDDSDGALPLGEALSKSEPVPITVLDFGDPPYTARFHAGKMEMLEESPYALAGRLALTSIPEEASAEMATRSKGAATKKTHYRRRSIGVLVVGSPLALLLASLVYALIHGERFSISGLVVEIGALLIAVLNFFVAFVRKPLFRWRKGSLDGYRNVSGAPWIGTLLILLGAVLGFGSITVAVLGLVAFVADTGGTPWFVIATWRDSSLWDEPWEEPPAGA